MPNTVNNEVWTGIRELSMNLVNRKAIERKMEEAIKNKLKYTSKVLSRNKLEYLVKNRVGTARIEALSKQIEGKSDRNVNTVMYIMQRNVNNVEREIKSLKSQIFTLDKSIKQSLHSNWKRERYISLCKSQTAKAWQRGVSNNIKSREHLLNKHGANIKNLVVKEGNVCVVIADDMTEVERQNFIDQCDEPVSLGLSITPEEKAFLQLPQNLTDHVTFNKVKALTDTAVMGTKYRMTVKDRVDQGISEDEVNLRTKEERDNDSLEKALETQVYDSVLNEASFAKMRVTSLKTCRRVTIPPPLPEKEEAKIQSVISDIEKAINKEAIRNDKLRVRPSTLTKVELTGLKMLRKRTKKGEAAIVATDKSGKMSVLSKSVYDEKILEHTNMDQIISMSDVAKLETVLSATSSSLAKVMQIGEAWGQTDRVQSAVKSELSSIPPLAMLLKDHKEGSNKPIRPLCRSAESPNGVLSELTSKVMQIVGKDINSRQLTKVCSTEQVCAILEDINDNTPENLDCLIQCGIIEQASLAQHQIEVHPDSMPEMVVGSMDVKALYPSLDIEHSVQIIREQMLDSQVMFDTNVPALALHLAATNTQKQLDREGLAEVCHSRRYNMGQRPIITSKSVTGTELEKAKYDSWVDPVRDPTPAEKKLMFAIAISQSVKLVMESHVYTNSDVIRLQASGGAIGLGSTGEVADLVMLRHDVLLEEALIKAGVCVKGKSRYVDDENPVFKPTPYGARLINDKVIVVREHIQNDKLIPHDQRTFKIVQQIANNIWKHIQFTVEVPSLSPNGLIPMLDMQVGIDQKGKITREFYCKPVATPFTILARSAHPWQTKRSTLTQEGVRRLVNTSTNCSEKTRNTIMQQWDSKMNVSGYSKKFRSNVIKSAIQTYNSKLVVAEGGGRPVYRPFGYEGEKSDINKVVAAHTWYTGNAQQRNQAPLIIDPTPTGEMENEIKTILSNASRTSDVRIKFCTRGGRKVSSKAKSDPFASLKCPRSECPVCSMPNSKGGCRFSNIGYQLSCVPCKNTEVISTYQGESAKSAYERGQQHHADLKRKVVDTPMWKHAQLHHESNNKIEFEIEVTNRFKKPMVRQEDEAIRIRESNAQIRLNSKAEFHQPSLIRLVPASGNQVLSQEGQSVPIFANNMFNHVQRNRVDSPNVPMRTRSRGLVSNHEEPNLVLTTRAQRVAMDENPTKYSKNGDGDRVSTTKTTKNNKNQSSTVQHGRTSRVAPSMATARASSNGRGTNSGKVQKTTKTTKKVNNVENNTMLKPKPAATSRKTRKLSVNNVAEHNLLGSDWVILSEWNKSSDSSSSDNATSNSNCSSSNTSNSTANNSNVSQNYSSPSQQFEVISPTSFTQSMARSGVQNSSVTNVEKLVLNNQFSQVSQDPLTQYITNKSHLVASVTSKVITPKAKEPSVKIVTKKRKMAVYKPASPLSPPSHMNVITVEAQIHSNRTQITTPHAMSDSEDSSPIQGTWSSWSGNNSSQNMQSSIQKHQAFEHELFRRSDTQAMSDLYLMKLDKMERQEEMVLKAVQNPIRTASAYNAFLKRRAANVPSNTSPQNVEASPVFGTSVSSSQKKSKITSKKVKNVTSTTSKFKNVSKKQKKVKFQDII